MPAVALAEAGCRLPIAMGQKKLKRFAEIATFPNVLQYPQGMKGRWTEFFRNENPITLELACGKGEYSLALGQKYPQRNFIGIDLKGNRIWVGAKKAIELDLQNVSFLRTQIEKLAEYFQEGEVSEIWLTFPDPQLRTSRAKKRLTHPRFLRLYQQILSPGGYIHLKTDSPVLYRFTLKVADLYGLHILEKNDDVYSRGEIADELSIKTYYESLDIARSNKVFYLKFTLPGKIAEDLDQRLHDEIKIDESGAAAELSPS